MNDLLKVKFISSKKGRGVFAKKDISKGRIIDVANVVLIPNNDYKQLEKTLVSNYCFDWENQKYKSENKMVLPMTICQFMNHSYNPNVIYEYNYKNDTIKFKTIKMIRKGEELTINYNGNPLSKDPVWFEVTE
ncbi:MAG: SET domain-containing protein-lysine N-methyltransferase [Candidatus Odinarchaeota archaeon]